MIYKRIYFYSSNLHKCNYIFHLLRGHKNVQQKSVFNFYSAAILLVLIICFGCKVSDEEVSELVAKGKRTYTQAKYDSARIYFEEALFLRPDSPEVHYFLGYTLEKLSSPDGASIPDTDIELIEQSSDHFKKVIELSPKYGGEQLALDPYSKITSLWGSVALKHLNKGDVEAAKKAFLKGKSEGGFYPAILEYNKNTMRSCKPDAILFTNGDNDTFPMYYLQVVESFRTDITVVNLSLLNTEWYIRFLTKSRISKNISVQLSELQLSRLKPMRWSSKRNVQIKVPKTKNSDGGILQIEVAPTLRSGYIRIQDLLLLNIINTNKWIRDVYFSVTVAGNNFIGFKKHCPMEGLVMHLSYQQKESDTMEKLKENLKDNYSYASLSTPHLEYIPQLRGLFQNYRILFYSLLNYYKKHSRTQDIKNTLQFMNAKLPIAVLPYSNERLKTWMDDLEKDL